MGDNAGSSPRVPPTAPSGAPDPADGGDDGDDGGTPGTRLTGEVLQRRWHLVLPHREQLLRIARRRVPTREDAEDVVGTAMVRTVEHERLDESRIGAFLCTTVMRLTVDVHRERARQLAIGVRDATRELPPASLEESVCDDAEARWLAGELRECPAREREVLAARVSGLSAQDVTSHLGLTAKAAENAFTRVRHRAQGLVATSMAGVAAVLGYVRRTSRPAIAAVPIAAVTVIALGGGHDGSRHVLSPDAPAAAGTVHTPVARVVPSAAPAPLVPPAPPVPRPTATAVAAPSARAVTVTRPVPARTEVRVPAVVDRRIVDPGGVYVETRHKESFEASVRRCLRGVDLNDPLADPCR